MGLEQFKVETDSFAFMLIFTDLHKCNKFTLTKLSTNLPYAAFSLLGIVFKINSAY